MEKETREKVISAEIMWTAVPLDDRQELKGTLIKEKGEERNHINN
jgi:hypothetical protein